MQVIAEGGHMSDVMPSLAAALIDLTPVDFGVSATYGEASIRVFATSNRAGIYGRTGEATTGFAHLRGTFRAPVPTAS